MKSFILSTWLAIFSAVAAYPAFGEETSSEPGNVTVPGKQMTFYYGPMRPLCKEQELLELQDCDYRNPKFVTTALKGRCGQMSFWWKAANASGCLHSISGNTSQIPPLCDALIKQVQGLTEGPLSCAIPFVRVGANGLINTRPNANKLFPIIRNPTKPDGKAEYFRETERCDIDNPLPGRCQAVLDPIGKVMDLDCPFGVEGMNLSTACLDVHRQLTDAFQKPLPCHDPSKNAVGLHVPWNGQFPNVTEHRAELNSIARFVLF